MEGQGVNRIGSEDKEKELGNSGRSKDDTGSNFRSGSGIDCHTV